jgi:membrane associated rhomboid family serine protease
MLGSGLAWFSILVAGAFGNLLAALIRPIGHTSIGASTAVFAALGLLAGRGWADRRRLQTSSFVRYAPIIGAVVLLSYLGTAGERTDVLAHVTGFVSGLFVGAAGGRRIAVLGSSGGHQLALGIGTVVILVLAWLVALVRDAGA